MAFVVPRYWVRTEGEVVKPAGWTGPDRLVVWGWSSTSRTEAEANAQTRLARARERVALPGSDYGYERAPLREPILEEFTRADGSLFAAITRNRAGVRVLNTERVMFVDVDLPPDAGNIFAAILRLFRRPGSASPLDSKGELTGGERAAIARIESALKTRPGWSIRVYRTRAGLRLLATHDLFAPDDPAAHAFMKEVGADPWYVKLCRARSSFRARLTAKPERMGFAHLALEIPIDDTDPSNADYARWVADYERDAKRWAACQLLKTVGTSNVHPEAARVIDLHDRGARAGSALPLA